VSFIASTGIQQKIMSMQCFDFIYGSGTSRKKTEEAFKNKILNKIRVFS